MEMLIAGAGLFIAGLALIFTAGWLARLEFADKKHMEKRLFLRRY